MQVKDFKFSPYISSAEVRATGAQPKDVKCKTILILNMIRHEVGLPIILIKNGLTTGKHSSPEHPAGLAADFMFDGDLTFVDVRTVYRLCLKLGVRGFGVYYNGKVISFHIDFRKDYSEWIGVKEPGQRKWKYGSFLVDIKNVKL